MSITTTLDAGNGNGGRDPNATTQGVIAITQTQDGEVNYLLVLHPPPHPPDGTKARAAGHTSVTAVENCSGGGGTITNP